LWRSLLWRDAKSKELTLSVKKMGTMGITLTHTKGSVITQRVGFHMVLLKKYQMSIVQIVYKSGYKPKVLGGVIASPILKI